MADQHTAGALPLEKSVVVIGAGTMGSGIAEVAAAAGHTVYLRGANDAAVERGLVMIRASLDKRVARGKLESTERDAVLARIRPAMPEGALAGVGLVIEVSYEDLEAKVAALAAIEPQLAPDAIIATNTSSLSVTALAWGKTPVNCRSTPGFIVNRVARPFYGEALRLLQEQAASPATLDAVMRESGGFRMGPCELMDLIGHDVNFAVTRSVYEAFFDDPRYQPSLMQKDLVDAGWLGRKSGRGFFDYREGAAAIVPDEVEAGKAPALVRVEGDPGAAQAGADDVAQAAGLFAALGKRVSLLADVPGMLVMRTVAMLVNEGAEAVYQGIASAESVDAAMCKGVNYPVGPMGWGRSVGLPAVLTTLRNLGAGYGEDRYRSSVWLQREVQLASSSPCGGQRP